MACRWLALTLALFAGTALHAATVQLVNLEQMMAAADRVFVGRVVQVYSTVDSSNLPVRFTRFEVVRPIKGDLHESVVIKQLASRVRGKRSLIPGMPTYSVGQEFVLFLSPESKAGFSSPVGLFQGQLSIVTEPGGTKKVRGAFTTGRLLSGLKKPWLSYSVMSATTPSAANLSGTSSVDYGQFMGILDDLAKGK